MKMRSQRKIPKKISLTDRRNKDAVSDHRETECGTGNRPCHRCKREKRRLCGGKRLSRFMVCGTSGRAGTAGGLFGGMEKMEL